MQSVQDGYPEGGGDQNTPLYDRPSKPTRKFPVDDQNTPLYDRPSKPTRKFPVDDQNTPLYDRPSKPTRKFPVDDQNTPLYDRPSKPTRKFPVDDNPPCHRYVVLASAILGNALMPGYNFGAGRLLVTLIDVFATSRAKASVVFATVSSVTCCFGIIAGLLVQRFGPRMVATVGVVLDVLMFGVSYFATSIPFLVLTHVGVGIGSSLVYISCSRVLLSVFTGRARYTALSSVVAGSGLGGTAYSYLLAYLEFEYSLRGTYLILCGLVLNGLPLVLTWPAHTACTGTKEHTDELRQPVDDNTGENKRSDATTFSAKKTIVHVLTTLPFVLFTLGAAIVISAMTIIYIFVSDAMMARGHSPSFALFLFNLFSTAGRFAPGALKQLSRFSVLIPPFAIGVVGACSSVIMAMLEDEASMILCTALHGFTHGLVNGALPVASAILIGDEHMSTAFGVILTLLGLLIIVSSPLSGFIRDVTNSYTGVFFTTAGMSIIGSFFLLSAMLTRRRI